MTNQHRQLTALTQMALQQVQGEMQALQRKEADLRANLLTLTTEKQQQPQDTMTWRWHIWVDQRRATINAELAQVLAQMDHCRRRLTKVFGRNLAAEALLRQVQAADLRKSARKDAQGIQGQ
jgi:hypothetical protein